MEQDFSLGSEPGPDSGCITDLVERAFRYRSDVTVETGDGEPVTGYLFNRNANCSEPFIQLFVTGTGREITVPYRCITRLRFTGRDAAAPSARRYEDSRRQKPGTTRRTQMSTTREQSGMGTKTAVTHHLTIAPTQRELGGLGSGHEGMRARVVGMGSAAGGRVAALLEEGPCRLLVSLGYAGALEPHLRTGDLVIGAAYLHGAEPPVSAVPLATRAAVRLREAGLSVQEGPVLTVDEPLLSPRAKRRARQGSGALVVDMEGWWIAEAAARRGVPLIGIRAVLDEAQFSLPAYVAAIIADSGRREWSHAIRAMPHPSALKSFLPLAMKSRGASRALEVAVHSMVAALPHRL